MYRPIKTSLTCVTENLSQKSKFLSSLLHRWSNDEMLFIAKFLCESRNQTKTVNKIIQTCSVSSLNLANSFQHIMLDHVPRSSVQRPNTIHVSYCKSPYADHYLSTDTKEDRILWEIGEWGPVGTCRINNDDFGFFHLFVINSFQS